MRLFGRRKESREPLARDLSGDAAAMRATLRAMQAEPGRGGDAVGQAEPDRGDEVALRAIARDLLEGEVAAPTADVAELIARGTNADEFYDRELKPSWEGLSEAQRARRVDGFIELGTMLASGGEGLPPGMGATVRTKTLLLAWAFDETYGYLSRLTRGETGLADD